MSQPSAWRSSPSGRRSVSDFAEAIRAGNSEASLATLIVGAGVDAALAGRPLWGDLIAQVGMPCTEGGQPDQLAEVARTWPMEAAEALSVTLGPDAFYAGLTSALSESPKPSSPALGDALGDLIRAGVRLIISLNYTDDLLEVLQEKCPKHQFMLIDRRELSAWPFGRLLHPTRDTIHVVKLHGSLRSTNEEPIGIVLNRTSYDDVASTHESYGILLQRLFEDSVVLTVGVSWSDLPLRDAAGRSRHRIPVAGRTHFALKPHNDTEAYDWWESRSLTSSYGLRPLFYRDHGEVAEAIKTIADAAVPSDEPSLATPLGKIADWLDSAGDFESCQQSAWFAKNWEWVALEIEGLKDRSECISGNEWMSCVRIERHLRHFLWFWLTPEAAKDRRRRVWNSLASSGERLAGGSRELWWRPTQIVETMEYESEFDLNAAAILDFAVGAFEVFGDSPSPGALTWRLRAQGLWSEYSSSRAGKRVELASKVFTSSYVPTPELLARARGARWEGLESKIALDLCQAAMQMARAGATAGLRDLPLRERERLARICQWAQGVARVAGSARREVGATVLGSLVVPVERAESDLIASYRGLAERSRGLIEPTAAWSIVIGLVAAFVDDSGAQREGDLIHALTPWLGLKCGSIPVAYGVAQAVQENYSRHWSQFHSRAGELAPLVAASLVQIQR